MQLYPLLLVAIVLAADGGMRAEADQFGLSAGQIAMLAVLPQIAIVLLVRSATWFFCRRMDRQGSAQAIMSAERITRQSRWVILAWHAAAVLMFGWLDTVRSVTGNLILIDELIVLLPPLLAVIGTFWAYYPVERRWREALIVRRLDDGRPLHPMPSRSGYVWNQTRMGLLILLVPVLLIVGLSQTVRVLMEPYADAAWGAWVMGGALFFSAAMVFIFAPVMMRYILNVEPIPPGPLRDMLLEICRAHNVGVRELLIWRTGGMMINAAVMGLIGRLRYVMITDGLLESMGREQVRAVMAHEIGHVRHRHIPWLVMILAAALLVTSILLDGSLMLLGVAGVEAAFHLLQWMPSVALLTAVQLVIVLIVFGWVSRRFERQADTFAVKHLSAHPSPLPVLIDRRAQADAAMHDPSDQGDHAMGVGGAEEIGVRSAPISRDAIDPEAVLAMNRALGLICELNLVDPERPSWRHGSIAWRQRYLRSIVGAPIGDLPIDRTISRLKWTALTLLIASLLLGAVIVRSSTLQLVEAASNQAVCQWSASHRLVDDVVDHAGLPRRN